jgi:hypothetical protein
MYTTAIPTVARSHTQKTKKLFSSSSSCAAYTLIYYFLQYKLSITNSIPTSSSLNNRDKMNPSGSKPTKYVDRNLNKGITKTPAST